MSEHVLLGDEAVGLGALHAGASFAYGYPGTPSTEIIEYMQHVLAHNPAELFQGSAEPLPRASWCSNEKTAYEAAIGASAVNRRVLVTMKHVGLNVAADPFMNSTLMNIQGGVVLAVGDDPGMHSSQNEQDSRYFADFAKMPCLEPHDQQEAYEMTREAFDLSERFHVPVLLKLVTRLSHSRAVVRPRAPRARNPMLKFSGRDDFMVLPATSRKNYAAHLGVMVELERESVASAYNPLVLADEGADIATRRSRPFAVITTGLGRNYYEENASDLGFVPDHLHIGMYPLPMDTIRRLAEGASRVICIEEGYPYVERLLKGIVPQELVVSGKLDGTVQASGELDPDNVRAALGLSPLKSGAVAVPFSLPGRPPQLCQGCPHADTFIALKEALSPYPESLVTSDIGCYSLGFLPPHQVIETALCMGASITMGRGAAESGMHPVVAVLGDSTFMHSGLTGLTDVVSAKLSITVIILDNYTTGMTGGQDTIVASPGIRAAVLGLGVEPEHCVEIVPLAKNREQNVAIIAGELAYRGVSVVIAKRECIQTLKRRNAKQGAVS
ncbi:MAG: indolepyruvate ferredoxin oxidoreductase [Spirochaetales bacterium]|nr:indolepyruvate ferredoxin oxidoreductase [Spirochaetales bacterium]